MTSRTSVTKTLMRRFPTLLPCATALVLAACDGDRPTAPVALSDPVHAIVVPLALLDAIGDARERKSDIERCPDLNHAPFPSAPAAPSRRVKT